MVLLVVLGCALFLVVGYLTYSKFLAKKGMLSGRHFFGIPAIPVVSLILLILSVLVAAETILSVKQRKKLVVNAGK